MSKLWRFLITIIVMTAPAYAHAQGCSDAGFCSAGALQSGKQDSLSKRNNSVGLSCAISIGEQKTFIVIPQLELQYRVSEKTTFEIKFPWYYANGSVGYNSQIGDVLATFSRPIVVKNKWLINGTAGLRISTGNANASFDNIPLPMPYQSNLGTTDLILGVGVKYGKYISIGAGLQQPLAQYNKNQYFATMPDDKTYFSSRNLDRRGDVLLRAEGHYSFNKLLFSAGPLLIYHLGKDIVRSNLGQEIIVDGSDGFTLNISGSASYTINRIKLEIAAGTPLAVRANRPDGLTRKWVAAPKLSFLF